MHLNNGRKKMNEYVRKRIEEMSIDFTSVQSVVDTEGEIVMAEKIYDTMSQIDYYKKNPDIKWNFTKFLVDRQGNVVARFEPTTDMAEVESAIKNLLA